MASINQGVRQGSDLGNQATRKGSANRGFVSIDPERQREVPDDADGRKIGSKTGQAGAPRTGTPRSEPAPRSR